MNSRMDNTEERINGLDDRIMEITQLEKGIENVFEEIMAENFPKLTKKRYSCTGCTEGSQTS